MVRRRRSGSLLELVVLCPWWVGLALAVVVYLVVGLAVGSLPEVFEPLGKSLRVVGNVFAGLFVLAGVCSLIRSVGIRRDLEKQGGLESLAAMPWKAFEDFVGEVYRRQGYSVEERLGGGADGGVDLVLRREGERTLVQCKRWTGRAVGAPVVRELYGVMVSEGADAAVLVTTSRFTKEVRDFVRGKPVMLVDGRELAGLVRQVQRSGRVASVVGENASSRGGADDRKPEERNCPQCGAAMVRRVARKGARAGREFWGCSTFPRCRAVVDGCG